MSNLANIVATGQTVLPSVLGWGIGIGLALALLLDRNTRVREKRGEVIARKSTPTPDNGYGADARVQESLEMWKGLFTKVKAKWNGDEEETKQL